MDLSDFYVVARSDQQSEEFRLQMHQRNAIEGTISELVRSHGLRRARYKGFAKVDLQNQLIAAACNIKRWFRKLLGTVFGAQKEDLGLSGAFPWSVLADFFVQIDQWSSGEKVCLKRPSQRKIVYRAPMFLSGINIGHECCVI